MSDHGQLDLRKLRNFPSVGWAMSGLGAGFLAVGLLIVTVRLHLSGSGTAAFTGGVVGVLAPRWRTKLQDHVAYWIGFLPPMALILCARPHLERIHWFVGILCILLGAILREISPLFNGGSPVKKLNSASEGPSK